MDPKEQISTFYQIENQGFKLLAFYHSHPFSPPIPSPTDLAEWTYPEIPLVLIGNISGEWKLFAFLLDGENFTQIELKIRTRQQPI